MLEMPEEGKKYKLMENEMEKILLQDKDNVWQEEEHEGTQRKKLTNLLVLTGLFGVLYPSIR